MILVNDAMQRHLVHIDPITAMRRVRGSHIVLGLAKRSRWTRKCLAVALRFEGSSFYSTTARQIMSTFYDVRIGDYSYGPCFEPGVLARGTSVGRYVSIGPRLRAYTANHPTNRLSTHPFFFNAELGYVPRTNVPFTRLTIEDDVWVGDSVIITPGCARLGRGSIIGAGSVLTRNVPEFSVVGGVPGRVLRRRFPLELEMLVRQSHWWDKPLPTLLPFCETLSQPLEVGAMRQLMSGLGLQP